MPPELVQGWASFVRRGHLPGVAGPIKPIEIDYDLCAEDQIAEIISRLDEIGDVIDGLCLMGFNGFGDKRHQSRPSTSLG